MKNESLTNFMTVVISDLRLEGRYGTAYVYEYALRAFTEFVGGGEIFFSAVSRRWLKRFEQRLRESLKSWNTVSTYIRMLRAVYNRAVDSGLIAGEYRLFSGVFTGVTHDKKRALSAGDMRRLLDREATLLLPAPLRKAQDCLRLMTSLQGLPFVDLAHLQKEDLKEHGGRCTLTLRRRKTGSELHVSVLPEALELLNRYRNTDPASPLLLNFLSGRSHGEAAFSEYRHRLGELNRGLSRLARFCRLEADVSSYTARHTWATLAKYCQVPEEVISEGLGHSSLEVTRTYLKRFEGDELDRANRIIIDYICNGVEKLWNRL